MGYEDSITNREHKASAFTTYFGIPENAAELYEALSEEEIRPDKNKTLRCIP